MIIRRLSTCSLFLLLLIARQVAQAQAVPDLTSWQPVATVLQTPAVAMPGYVRFNFPRVDFSMTMHGVPLAPAMVQGGWLGFAGPPTAAVMLGDLVVRLPELAAVVSELEARGIEVSAVHNHLLGEEPPVAYVHVAAVTAHGGAAALAVQVDSVLRLTGLPRPVTPIAAAGSIDSAAVFGALGLSGRTRGAVAQGSVVLVRDSVRWRGHTLPAALILASPINLQAVDSTRFVATGDFVLTSHQVQPLVRALAAQGVLITAVHGHLVGEAPPLTFVHFWADGTLERVAGGLRAGIAAARAATS